ncbi:hypothetical protein F4808DRAFT_458324 [Astrocystis sublimbata]|nr:hypothetical protein F4808DRAFT_458324 [Astrocystis sublimbata]
MRASTPPVEPVGSRWPSKSFNWPLIFSGAGFHAGTPGFLFHRPPAYHSFTTTMNSGQFDWFLKIGATKEAVAVLNDQPHVFFVLLAALILLILEGVFIWFIHWATLKPEQKKKKEKKGADKKPAAPGAKPPAQR